MPIPKELERKLAQKRRESEEKETKLKADKLGLMYLNPISVEVPTETKALKLVPKEIAEKARLAPLHLVDKNLIVTVFDPENPEAKKVLGELKEKYNIRVAISSMSGLKHAWDHYKYVEDKKSEIIGRVEVNEKRLEEIKKKVQTIEEFGEEIKNFNIPLTSQILETILGGAFSFEASDIHLEPAVDKKTIVRIRIDGILHTVFDSLNIDKYYAIITRIKLLSKLKINIKDRAQDGRFTIGTKDRNIEIRTSIIPSEYGETIVLRILDPLTLRVDLESLGWRNDDLEIIRKEIKNPNGLIINTGPTGSGKTTTLYSFLRKVQTSEVKIITVEDPIEYHLPNISQTQVDPSAGYTFSSGLRSILRQDPDIILVGEIRDKETAEIAMNASLTGHIVFSTLHTNDAVGGIPRLIDLGAKPQILAPSLSLIIAQRLPRSLCQKCKRKKETDPEMSDKISKFINSLPSRVDRKNYENWEIYEPAGCEHCGNIGYKGRIGIFELFSCTQEVQEVIQENPSEIALKKLARSQEMTTMQEDGILKILKGITSLEEIERLTGTIQWPS